MIPEGIERVANKLARIAWAVSKRGREYESLTRLQSDSCFATATALT